MKNKKLMNKREFEIYILALKDMKAQINREISSKIEYFEQAKNFIE